MVISISIWKIKDVKSFVRDIDDQVSESKICLRGHRALFDKALERIIKIKQFFNLWDGIIKLRCQNHCAVNGTKPLFTCWWRRGERVSAGPILLSGLQAKLVNS